MSKQERHLYEFGPYRLVPAERLLLRDGSPVALTPKAFETLVALVRRAGRLAEKEELLKELWPDSFVEESNLAQNIFALRRALGEGENGEKYIETVPKRGYRFLVKVRIVAETPNELSVEQHVSVRSSGQQIGTLEKESSFVSRTEAASGASLITVDPEHVTRLDLSRSAQRDVPEVGNTRWWRTRNVAIAFVVVAVALGGSALLYKYARRVNPPASFQTMKMVRLTTIGKVFDATISPDGKYVVYAIREGGRQSLWVRQTATQSQVQIVAPADHTFTGLNFSPDSNYIYYSVYSTAFPQRALFQVETLGGAPRKLLENLRADAISFAPDGKQFCFIRLVVGKESAIMIANADGTGERKLVTLNPPEQIHQSAWSPDGKKIAYVVRNFESNDDTIFEAQIADGSTKPLSAQKWFRILGLSWQSGGGGLMVLAPPDQTFGAQIWRLSYPQGEPQRLTNDLNSYNHISMTADSRTLAVVQSETRANIWAAPLADSSLVRPVTSGSGKSDLVGAWTPEGKIVYHSSASGTDDIWITDADGRNPRQLTANARLNQSPAVSPDGRYIVFHSDRTGLPHLWRMNIDGGDQRQLTNGAGGEQNPQFSPDGRWIFYRTALGRPVVWKMPAGGGAAVQLTDKLSAGPTVSPDGKWVAYTYSDGSAPAIEIAPLDGGEPLKRFALPRTFSRPLRWTPDGRAVAYIDSSNGVSNIVALPLDGRKPEPLTTFNVDQIFSFAFSSDGKQLALSRGTVDSDVVLIKDFR